MGTHLTQELTEAASEWLHDAFSEDCEILKMDVRTHRPSGIVWEKEQDHISTRVHINYRFNGRNLYTNYFQMG